MQELCQLCEEPVRNGRDHWSGVGKICDWCYDRWKWHAWHEGITPVRAKEVPFPINRP